jgi:thiol-disulfide isomerase/thioredoxin
MLRKRWIILIASLSLSGTSVSAQKSNPAAMVFENAKAQAANQHKLIILVFGASWCGPCHKLDAFLSAPELRQVFEKYHACPN